MSYTDRDEMAEREFLYYREQGYDSVEEGLRAELAVAHAMTRHGCYGDKMKAYLMCNGHFEGSPVDLVIIAPDGEDFIIIWENWRRQTILDILGKVKMDPLTKDECITCEERGVEMAEYHHAGRTDDNWGWVRSMRKLFLDYLKATYQTIPFEEMDGENHRWM